MSKEISLQMRCKVDEWRASGMSMELYAQKIGVTRHKLEYWIRKFRQESTTVSIPEFIEIKEARKLIPQEPDHQEVRRTQPQMELTFPSGACLKIYI